MVFSCSETALVPAGGGQGKASELPAPGPGAAALGAEAQRPPLGRAAPALALTRHVDAKQDALGRGQLGFWCPGLPEDQQVGK